MQIRLTPLPGRTQYHLDNAVDEGDLTSATGITLSLYGDAEVMQRIIMNPAYRTPEGWVDTLAHRRLINRELETYSFDQLAELPRGRKASILGSGLLGVAQQIASTAKFCARFAYEDETVGGAAKPFRDVWRCDDFYRATKRVSRRLHAPGWIARYVRHDETVGRVRGLTHRLFAQCSVLPDTRHDRTLAADLQRQLEAFRVAWRAEHAGDLEYVGAPGYDAPTLQAAELQTEADPADVITARRAAEVQRRIDRAFMATFANPKKPPYRVIRQERKVTKRAAVLAAALLGAQTVSAFARGEPIILPGQHVSLSVRPQAPMHQLGHGIAVALLGAQTGAHLADLCVYVDQTPTLDQLTAMALHMQAGLEAEVLASANVIRTHQAGVDHPMLVARQQPPAVPRAIGRAIGRLIPDRHARQQAAFDTYWRETRAFWVREAALVVVGNGSREKAIMRDVWIPGMPA